MLFLHVTRIPIALFTYKALPCWECDSVNHIQLNARNRVVFIIQHAQFNTGTLKQRCVQASWRAPFSWASSRQPTLATAIRCTAAAWDLARSAPAPPTAPWTRAPATAAARCCCRSRRTMTRALAVAGEATCR